MCRDSRLAKDCQQKARSRGTFFAPTRLGTLILDTTSPPTQAVIESDFRSRGYGGLASWLLVALPERKLFDHVVRVATNASWMSYPSRLTARRQSRKCRSNSIP